jgi:hypothetical protein
MIEPLPMKVYAERVIFMIAYDNAQNQSLESTAGAYLSQQITSNSQIITPKL